MSGAEKKEEGGAGANTPPSPATGEGGAVRALWERLLAAGARARKRRIADLFAAEPLREERFSVEALSMLFDFSKTAISAADRALLLDLARAAGLEARRDAMFAGEAVNETENRPALHWALRLPEGASLTLGGTDIADAILETRRRMAAFARALRAGEYRGEGGAAISDIVNIGIGGSDLGPAMATRALAPCHDGPRCHFVANLDPADISDTLAGLDPARTLVIVASKSFTTLETLTNARVARQWMAGAVKDPGRHFVAISAHPGRAREFGIDPARVFGFPDGVGGRYSLWGPIGLSLMIAIGPGDFADFLAGGHAMDTHFRTAPLDANMPVALALTGIWHRQVMGFPTRAVLPYDQRLARLPAYLQQLEMESNGKGVTLSGAPLDLPSAPVVWGEPGTNCQHSFFQMIHQGTDTVPCEFIAAAQGHEADLASQHGLLLANVLAQSRALMLGRGLQEARAMLAAEGLSQEEIERLAPHRCLPGNRPSTTLLHPRLTPRVLGQIIALYEHRVFSEGAILGINSFDQWGVELGKELALALVPVLEGRAPAEKLDPSTRRLLGWLAERRGGGG